MKRTHFTKTESKMAYDIMEEFDRESGRNIGTDPVKKSQFKQRRKQMKNKVQFVEDNKDKIKY